MLNFGNTIHFINRVDETNCGDKMCCPLLYYKDFFKRYAIKRHDIRYIDFDSIAPTDVVILGGGGLFDYAEFLNRAYNKLFDTGATVIAWSPGLNTHTEYDGTFQNKIHFEKFKEIGIRDYENDYGLPYLPDVTCKMPELKQHYTVKRKYGVARHKDYSIPALKNYDEITNNADIKDILRFIGETEIVFSNSFHLIYWSMLMGKKTVCVDSFSSRFRSYKYKPEYCDTSKDDIWISAKNAHTYDIIDECIEANDVFFAKVKKIIENRLTPLQDGYSDIDRITDEAVWQGRVRGLQTLPGDILVSQVYINQGNGYFEELKRVAINNVIGDEENYVKFDLSSYSNIKELRFDPIEGRFCRVEIVSATIDGENVEMIPEACIKSGTSAIFLNTDPQFFLQTSHCNTLEVKFRLCLLTSYEAEQSIREYVASEKNNLKKLVDDINDKVLNLKEKDILIENQSARLNEQNSVIEGQTAKISQQNSVIENQSIGLDEQNSIIANQNARINQQDIELQSLFNSHSWRITAPLRKIAAFFKRLFKRR